MTFNLKTGTPLVGGLYLKVFDVDIGPKGLFLRKIKKPDYIISTVAP